MNIRQVKSPKGEAAGLSFPKFLCRSAVLFPCQGGAARTEKMLKEYGGLARRLQSGKYAVFLILHIKWSFLSAFLRSAALKTVLRLFLSHPCNSISLSPALS